MAGFVSISQYFTGGGFLPLAIICDFPTGPQVQGWQLLVPPSSPRALWRQKIPAPRARARIGLEIQGQSLSRYLTTKPDSGRDTGHSYRSVSRLSRLNPLSVGTCPLYVPVMSRCPILHIAR